MLLILWMQATPVLIQASEGGSFDEMVDPRLEGNYNRDEMHRMVACAAICLRHAAKRRPKMSQVCSMGVLNFHCSYLLTKY